MSYRVYATVCDPRRPTPTSSRTHEHTYVKLKTPNIPLEWDSASSSSPKPAVSNVCIASINEVNTSALFADRSAYGNTSARRKVYANERVPLNTYCPTPLWNQAALAVIRRSLKNTNTHQS